MTASGDPLLANLARVRETIGRAAELAGRDPSEVRLVAASKTVPVGAMRRVAEAGVGDFGENYVKELRDKVQALPGVRWHFIGNLQVGSAHHVAGLADVVETLSGEHATRRLARRAAEAGRTLDALIEVDFTRERAGVTPEDLAEFAEVVASLEGIHLVGLMTLPPLPERAEDSRPYFSGLRGLRDRLRETHPDVLELSMGMSLDYEVAVAEGATMVRIGTALFGERPPA
ncbi:MAG: YggS family pyridoxal phosphate-dependent enzyme [Actinobacteria bacterium]|nr:YggS family pyridoxal phosphate-dependent enzyme [Actinomycetota bacterium]